MANFNESIQSDMLAPMFIATERFDPLCGQKWQSYLQWSKITGLVEVVSLDTMLCPSLIKEIRDEDWRHIVSKDFLLCYFYHLDYLKQRIQDIPRRNILGVYRNPGLHIETAPAPGDFGFVGYDLIEDDTRISALINCGGFPDVFANEELNRFGLIDSFNRASEVRLLLAERHPEEPHAQCEMYAIWKLNET